MLNAHTDLLHEKKEESILNTATLLLTASEDLSVDKEQERFTMYSFKDSNGVDRTLYKGVPKDAKHLPGVPPDLY